MRVALVSGFWAQNIGNAYFNIGGKWALEQVFGEGNVQFVQDKPQYRTFYDQSKGDPKNYAKLHERMDIDYLVLQGPLFTKNFIHIWGDTLKALQKRGVKFICLGSAFFKYTEDEIATIKGFFSEVPPAMISTRDSNTYAALKDIGVPVHDGIDSAFFVPRAIKPIPFVDEHYCFNFDRFPEPTVSLGQSANSHADFSFKLDDNNWNLTLPKVQQWFSMKGKSQAYMGHLLDRRKLPSDINGIDILRPEHRYVPHMTHKIYQHPNSFVSDETFTYFSVYAASKLTLADRVHACVMSLAYGNPAMLFTISPRQSLFARLGLEDIRNKPVTLSAERLEEAQEGVLKFLRDNVELIES